MADIHSTEIRSYNMSMIRGKHTKPEMLVRLHLFSTGLRYKLHDKSLPGTPDIVLPKFKTVIQVQGCFWHAHHGCKYFVMPKTRKEFWKNKIDRNVINDRRNLKVLRKLGWRVITVWECQLKSSKRASNLDKLVDKITRVEAAKRI